MTIEVVLLALASTVRPTSLAAVYALVGGEAPRRLMLVYIGAGLVFTIGFGLLVIWAFSGVGVHSGTDRTKGVAEIVGGSVVLVFAVSCSPGASAGRTPMTRPTPPRHWESRLGAGSPHRRAAIAGPATHIPGLFYLVALNMIVAHHPNVLDGLAEVLVYNLVWFALPFGALAICVVDPPRHVAPSRRSGRGRSATPTRSCARCRCSRVPAS